MILLLGGTSDIGVETARLLADGHTVVAAARRPEAVEPAKFPGATAVHVMDFDATDLANHRRIVEEAERIAGQKVTTAIIAFGILGEQSRAEVDESHAVEIATIDYTAHISMLTVLADHMEAGTIITFSSIAGWRPRRPNYVYGSTKAGLDAFAQGLADRLHGTGLGLYIARPGFVIGSMTEGMSPTMLSSRPHEVAEAVVQRVKAKKPGTFWIPKSLAIVAAIMKLVPRFIWRHMPR